MRTIITLCASVAFYKHVGELADQLERMGFKVRLPKTARTMRDSGNYDVDSHKTWYDKPEDFAKKSALIRAHFEEVAKCDAILVVNDEKHGIQGYIGPNVLMEMGLAFYLNKAIYVLNALDKDTPVYEEVLGMNSIILNGDLMGIKG